LLLLGGRLADVFGRRRLFLAGVGVFAVASAVCGAAVAPAMLVSGRFVQGLGEALAAPAALGLIALLFPHPGERAKAIGLWGGVSGIAGVSGVVISGVLTGLASWRWIFLINLPIALIALIAVPKLVNESRMTRTHTRIDLTGALIATAGLIALVYGLLQAAEHPWGSTRVLLPILAGLLGILLMIVLEARASDPLIPLRFFTNRTRTVANLVGLLFLAAFISYFFLVTLFLQQILHFSPLRGGLAYLPFGIAMGIGIGFGAGFMPRAGVKPILTIGFLGAAAAFALTATITPDSHYLSGVLPGMVLFGLCSGLVVPAIANAALHDVTGQDASLASGVQQAVQQVGSALGLAVLVTLALRHTHNTPTPTPTDITDGYTLALYVAAAILTLNAILTLTLLQKVTPQPRSPLMEVDLEPTKS
jgi:EmrB/QacA subfamily drug resistance transporter